MAPNTTSEEDAQLGVPSARPPSTGQGLFPRSVTMDAQSISAAEGSGRPELSRRPVSVAGAASRAPHDLHHYHHDGAAASGARHLHHLSATNGSPSSSGISFTGSAHNAAANHRQNAARNVRAEQLEGRSYRFAASAVPVGGDHSDISLRRAGSRNRGNASEISAGSLEAGVNGAAHGQAGAGAFSPGSYTADELFIRDRTAQLADMVMKRDGSASGGESDDDSSQLLAQSQVYPRGERKRRGSETSPVRSRGGGRTNAPRFSNAAGFETIDAVLHQQQQQDANATAPSSVAGPSNLAIALQKEREAAALAEGAVADTEDANEQAGKESPDTIKGVAPNFPPSASPAPLSPGATPQSGKLGGTGIPLTYTTSFGSNVLDRTDEETEDELRDEEGGEEGVQEIVVSSDTHFSNQDSAGYSDSQGQRSSSLQRQSHGAPGGLNKMSASSQRRASRAQSHFGYGALVQAQEEAEAMDSNVSITNGSTSATQTPFTATTNAADAAQIVSGPALTRRKSGVPQNGHSAYSQEDERTPLLQHHPAAANGAEGGDAHASQMLAFWHASSLQDWKYVLSQKSTELSTRLRKVTWQDALSATAEPVRLLPAVILGLLMNVLDGVSYGMITFPTSYPIFSNFGGDGVSMFFMTCILSQLVYSLGGSIFGGGNGSMQIEVVPFYHILVKTIIDEVGEDNSAAVISTTIVAFALSSIFIGLTFLFLGWMRLGKLIEFFPRHILVGCIGGVGVFLIETGLEVSGRLEAEEGFQWNWATLQYFIQSWHMVALWLPPLLLAILLRIITHRFHHPLIFPAYFMFIPIIFYIIVFGILRTDFATLRSQGWVFDIGEAANAPFYRYFTYINFRQTSFRALIATTPTQLALTFFGILHVPLNVPALGISVAEDNVDTDRELVGHGLSNLAAGLAFAGPNYITYVNSVLFYRVGGGSRLSGLMLAAGTGIILLAGPGMIGYLPVSLVGTLIFVLGIDLVKESLWDTVGRVNRWEYFTIIIIIIVMTLWDFVVGILAGIILACLFFVVQNSRRKTVRAIFDGSIARSTVRRHMTQRRFLDAVGTQTQILKLQGFLFFGTINGVEQLIRRALDIAAWNQNPMRFLIVDFSLVSGVDFSAAEAFTRIQRLLEAKGVVLVFCGVSPDSEVGIALRNVGMWADQGVRLEVFAHLNSALEWTENEYLRGMYVSNLSAGKVLGQASLAGNGALDVPGKQRQPAFVLDEAFENSPRRQHIHEAAKKAITHISQHLPQSLLGTSPTSAEPSQQKAEAGGDKEGAHEKVSKEQPLPLILATFRAYAGPQLDEHFFAQLVGYFERIPLPRGQVLWQEGDESDGLYLIESGILKAKYDFVQENFDLSESMMAGTIAGELTFLSKQSRNTTVHAELDCVLWKLGDASLHRLQQEQPAVCDKFLQILLRVAGDEQQALMSYLVSRLT